MNIGILNIQGDVFEHYSMIKKLSKKFNINPITVNNAKTLSNLDGLIIPGGESTVIYKFLLQNDIYDRITEMANEGMGIMGTCAGAIILAKNTNDDRVKEMNLINMDIKRNAYGRQINSFIQKIEIKNVGNFDAVFIRAPEIENVHDADILAEYNNNPVIVKNNKRNKNIIAMTFHPELTGNTKVHEFFINNLK